MFPGYFLFTVISTFENGFFPYFAYSVRYGRKGLTFTNGL